jgi:heme-degrading monooxygenase HmoA
VHVRHVTVRQAQDIDAGLDYLVDFLPVLSQQHGFRGVSVSADREGGLFGVTSQWATEEDLEASDSALGKARDEGLKIVGGVMTIETFELTTDAIARVPTPGNPVIVARVSMDPDSIERQITRFENELLPAIRAQRGFGCLRLMANRKEGRIVLGMVWQDRPALENYMASMEGPRKIALTQGVRIDEISHREILLIEVD